jgi:hypothetical protein
MCFTVHEDYPKQKVAKRNLLVFKYGEFVKGDFTPSCYTDFHYKKNVVNSPVKLLVDGWGDIEEGYHSYYKLHTPTFYEGKKGIFLIPKGTEYYIDPDCQEVVSRQLVYLQPYSKKSLEKLLLGDYSLININNLRKVL